MIYNDFKIKTMDDYELSTSFFPANTNESLIIICGAIGVSKYFYKSFASYCQKNNFNVITFDYRGMEYGDNSFLKTSNATFLDWGTKDIPNVIQWAKDNNKFKKLYIIGHSAGAQLLGFLNNHTLLDKAIFITPASADWHNWDGYMRYVLCLNWYFLMPVLTKTLGYFPAKLLKLGNDLPKDVALQWSKWAKQPDYFFSENKIQEIIHHEKFHVPIMSYSFTDDSFGPEKAINNLLKHYSGCNIIKRHISPKSINLDSIGHIGFFKNKCENNLWPEALSWLAN